MSQFELFVLLPLAVCGLLVQSLALFIDARKRGGNPWFWGLWGLIQLPTPTLFYLLFVIWPRKRRKDRMRKD